MSSSQEQNKALSYSRGTNPLQLNKSSSFTVSGLRFQRLVHRESTQLDRNVQDPWHRNEFTSKIQLFYLFNCKSVKA